MGAKSRPWNQVLLAATGVALVVAAVGLTFAGLNEFLAGLLVLLGVGLVVLAGFWSRIVGTVKITKDGIEIPIAALDRAESQIEQGSVVPLDPAAGGGFFAPSTTGGRTVEFVVEALGMLWTIPEPQRQTVMSEIEKLRQPDYDEKTDPLAIKVGSQGRSYRVHKVPGTDVRVWYRPLANSQSDKLEVVVIERA